MNAIQHVIRGCGTVPHCGEHPGTGFIFMMAAMGLAAGAKGGWIGALGGAAIMLSWSLPLYLWGAYNRSRISERMDQRK